MKKILKRILYLQLVLIFAVAGFWGTTRAAEAPSAWAGNWETIGSINNGGLYYPKGVAADSVGNVYVANFLQIVTLPSGSSMWQPLPNNPFAVGDYPWGVAVDGSDNLYVVNSVTATTGSRAIWKYMTATQTWTDITHGTQFRDPEGIAVDRNGNVYVTDTGNSRVMKLASGTTNWIVIGDGTSTNEGFFIDPRGIAVDRNNTVYVTDWHVNRGLLRILPSGTSTWQYNQVAGLHLYHATSIAVDSFDNIYVAKSESGEIIALRKNSTQWAYIKKGSPNSFISPFGVGVDGNGNVYVTDNFGNRGGVHKHQGWSTQLVWQTQPIGGYSGQPLTQQPVLWLVDGYGNRVKGANGGSSVTVSLTSPDGAVLSGTKTAILNDGAVSFSNLSIDKPGSYTLTVTSSITNVNIWDYNNPINLPRTNITSVSTSFEITAPPVSRIAGPNRYATAVAVSRDGWNSANTVLLARGDNYADALAGVPLAHHLNAPILLTRTDRLVEATKDEIERLNAQRVIILGGTGAISDTVKQELEMLGLTVERIAGANRYITAALIAERLKDEGSVFNTAFIVVGTNFADALAASTYAAIRREPILLTQTNHLPTATADALTELGIVSTVVCGGEAVISQEVYNLLPSPDRIFGSTRYGTAVALAEEFLPQEKKHVYIATGLSFPDAIAGAVLAAKHNSGILLVRGNQTQPDQVVQDFIADRNITAVTLFGGEVAISREIEEWFQLNLLK